MSIYVKVNNTEYPATVNGNRTDRSWDGRDTKTIYLTMSHDAVAALLPFVPATASASRRTARCRTAARR